MRAYLLVPLLLIASPAVAQSAPPSDIRMPPELTDPAMADKLTNMLQAMSKAFLNIPVGEVQAVVEGRPVTSADRRRTIRSETRMSERELDAKIEQSKPMIAASQRALASAIPAMMKAMTDAAQELERAGANIPRPDYPKR
jgi:hypothetical protein